MNSRAKGKRGELEFARLCRDHGYNCRRTAQYCGNTGESSDVVGLPGIHCEVKRVERLDILAAVSQAKRDAKAGEMPVVFHRKNNCELLHQKVVSFRNINLVQQILHNESPLFLICLSFPSNKEIPFQF